MIRQLAEQGLYQEFPNFVFSEQTLMPMAQELQAYLKELQTQENYPKLFEVVSQFPATSPLTFQPLYAVARAWANLGDAVRTDLFLRRALKELLNHSEALARAKIYSTTVLQQCLYIDTDAPFSAELKNPLSIHPACAHAEDDFFLVVSCNGLYVEKFAKEFFASLRFMQGKFHLHLFVSDPVPGMEALISEISRATGIRVQLHLESNVKNVLKFSCRRFQILPVLLAHHRGDAIVTDIDVQFTEALPRFVEEFPRLASAGLFEFANTAPMLICHCSLSYFRNSRATQIFANLLSNYITLKLSEDDKLWTLDQCGLFVISRLARQGCFQSVLGPEFRWSNLTTSLQLPLTHFQVDQKLLYQEKLNLRTSVDDKWGVKKNFEVSMTNALRPKILWH